MRITIFGVGRSGTKAVQLYLSYLIAQRENKVWINYEPYFWENRFTNVLNYEGYFHHMHSPHIVRTVDEISRSHVRFLKKLSISKMSSTTKFIRGNGRMDAINAILQPDHSIAIIRDVYQVLISVLKTDWDFWSVGFGHHQNWPAFIEEVRKKDIIDNFDWCLSRINDRIDQNAFYWYVMNKSLLTSKWPNTYFINYSEIKIMEEIARNILDPAIDLSINNNLFTGDCIHENYPLQSTREHKFLFHKMNGLLYKSKLLEKYGLFIPKSKYGSEAGMNTVFKKIQSARQAGSKLTIEKKDLYEYINEDISNMFEKVKWGKKLT